MAALQISTRQMELSEALANVGELKNVIANLLKENGFTDVVNTQGEVAGNKGDIRLSVLHLHVANQSFYQQVIAAGDNSNVTRGVVDDIMTKIKNLHFL
ncbi:hypothetical protein ABZX90_09400 [Streptomyces sp. NPDC002935]|uniref:hypothetical protein n=1 Tax=unclassified Streptomyces TaxID=2593676 RepID=UPI00332B51DB